MKCDRKKWPLPKKNDKTGQKESMFLGSVFNHFWVDFRGFVIRHLGPGQVGHGSCQMSMPMCRWWLSMSHNDTLLFATGSRCIVYSHVEPGCSIWKSTKCLQTKQQRDSSNSCEQRTQIKFSPDTVCLHNFDWWFRFFKKTVFWKQSLGKNCFISQIKTQLQKTDT